MTALQFTVYGLPAPQGSKRHVGNGVMVESSKRLKPWREDVRQAALDALPPKIGTIVVNGEPVDVPVDPTLTGPLAVDITFTLPRPKSHFGTGWNSREVKRSAPWYPASRPDLDKLARAILDAIGSAGVWRDDAQVVHLDVWKVYAGEQDALDRPGAVIRIEDEL